MKKKTVQLKDTLRLIYDKYYCKTYMRIFFQFILMSFLTYVIGEKKLAMPLCL